MKTLNTEIFIERAKLKWGELFDYSKSKYINIDTKIEIICPKHGVFEQTPDVHLADRTKHGCYKCSKEATGKKLNADLSDIKRRIFEKCGTEYELVNYKNINSIVIKHKCGIEIRTRLHVFLKSRNYKCRCSGAVKKSSNNEEKYVIFVEKSRKIHGNRYDYSESIITKFRGTKTKIKCLKHGYFFQEPSSHLSGEGCRKCGRERICDSRIKPEETKRKIEEKNGYKLIIIDERSLRTTFRDLKVQCKKCQKEMTFTCKNLMADEVECKFCGMKSRGERKIKRFLDRNNIKYKSQKTFSDCVNPKSKQPLRFDYYLEEMNICIEFDGVHHFKKEEHFGGNRPAWYAKTDYENIKFRDGLRDSYCSEKGIKMIRIPYWKKDQIDTILTEELLENK
jgi:very-short-patch-repair endonuclease